MIIKWSGGNKMIYREIITIQKEVEEFMNNRIKMTVKILPIVMISTFCKNGVGVIIKCYEG